MHKAFVESLNGRLRDECLNEHVFLSLAEACTTIEAWRDDYINRRPHSSLGALTPIEFAQLKTEKLIPLSLLKILSQQNLGVGGKPRANSDQLR